MNPRGTLLIARLASISCVASPLLRRRTPIGGFGSTPMGGFGSPVQAVGVLGWTGADQHGLDAASIQRYSRHLALPQFGAAAQGASRKGRSFDGDTS